MGKKYIYSKILIKSAVVDRQHFSLFLGYGPLRVARSDAVLGREGILAFFDEQ